MARRPSRHRTRDYYCYPCRCRPGRQGTQTEHITLKPGGPVASDHDYVSCQGLRGMREAQAYPVLGAVAFTSCLAGTCGGPEPRGLVLLSSQPLHRTREPKTAMSEPGWPDPLCLLLMAVVVAAARRSPPAALTPSPAHPGLATQPPLQQALPSPCSQPGAEPYHQAVSTGVRRTC